MDNHTADRARRQREAERARRRRATRPDRTPRPGKDRTPLDEGQQATAALAWEWAQPIIDRYRAKHSAPDYDGFVAERITTALPTYLPRGDGKDGKRFRIWIEQHIRGACLDAMRASVAIGPAWRGDRDGRRPEGRRRVHQISALEARNRASAAGRTGAGAHMDVTPEALSVRDPAGHLERMDGFRDLIRGASQVERLILIGYYWHDRTMKEIGEDLGLSESRVSQIHSRALALFRENLAARVA